MTKADKQHKASLRSKVALLLLVVFVLPLAASCRSKVFSTKEISAPEMARLIVDSMLDLENAESDYYQIPEEQKDGMSYSEFYEYISILIKMLPADSTIESFDLVSGKERKELIAKLLECGSPTYASIFESCVPVRVETNSERLSSTPIYFYIQQKDDGSVFLSRQWARRCMDIYAYSVHYFEAYQSGNLGDVVSLLPSTGIDESILKSTSVLTSKAREMIQFYSGNVKTDFAGYELCSIDAANLLFLQPEVFDNTHLKTSSRFVEFSYDSSDKIVVDDSITSDLKSADLYLYYNGHRAIRIGENATSAQIQTFLGAPVSVSCGPVIKTEQRWAGEDVSYRNILVRYKGFAITIYGIYNDESDWEGNFVHFRIWDTAKVTIGTSISSSSTTWDILERYPFAEKTDYDLQMTLDNERYEMKFYFDEPEDSETEGADDQQKTQEGGKPISEIILAWRRT